MKLATAFQHYTDVDLSLLGLFLFLAVFVGTVVWTGIKHNQLRYEKMATGLLEENETPFRRGDER